MRLDHFENRDFSRGRPAIVEAAWIAAQYLILSNPLPGSWFRRWALRVFGAKLGKGVVIKPGVIIKFPWRLSIGDHTWLGERVWIDNLAPVTIGSHCCLSQSAYLCTGSHDWSTKAFDLITKPIVVGDCAWIAAGSAVGPGVTIGSGVVLSLGAVATKDLNPWSVYAGNPAQYVKPRARSNADYSDAKMHNNATMS